MNKLLIVFIALVQMGCADDNYYYKNNHKLQLTPYHSMPRSNSSIDYYKNEKGIILGVSNKIIVKLKDGGSIEKYYTEFNLTLEKNLAKNLYLLKTSDKRVTIDISNRLSDQNDIEYAHPDFIKKRMRR